MIAAAILTGGRARRLLGRDKSRLVIGQDGRTILERQIDLLAPLVSEILIVTSARRLPDFAALAADAAGGRPPVRVVADRDPDAGPLAAVVTALQETRSPALFVLAGDMPDVTAEFIRDLAAAHAQGRHDVTAPQSSRGLEPLAALYGASARPSLESALASGERSLQRALRALQLALVPAADALFRNINTPDDL